MDRWGGWCRREGTLAGAGTSVLLAARLPEERPARRRAALRRPRERALGGCAGGKGPVARSELSASAQHDHLPMAYGVNAGDDPAFLRTVSDGYDPANPAADNVPAQCRPGAP